MEVPFVNVILANDEDVFTVRTPIVPVAPKSDVPVAIVYVRRPANVEVPETLRAVMDEVVKVP